MLPQIQAQPGSLRVQHNLCCKDKGMPGTKAFLFAMAKDSCRLLPPKNPSRLEHKCVGGWAA